MSKYSVVNFGNQALREKAKRIEQVNNDIRQLD